MIGNVSSKALAWGGITALAAGMIAIGTEVTKSAMYESQKARAATEAATAEMEKSKAEKEKAIAAKLEANASKVAAENLLHAAEQARMGTTIAAEYMAKAQRDAAKIAGDSLLASSTIVTHPDNEMYNSITGPLFGEPAKRIEALNDKIVKLKREAEKGIDHRTLRPLSESERAERTAQKQILEEELETVKETSSKNIKDAIGLVLGSGSDGLFGNMGSLYPTGNEPKVERRIIQEP